MDACEPDVVSEESSIFVDTTTFVVLAMIAAPVVLGGYAYAAYPVLLKLAAIVRRIPVSPRDGDWPSVTIVVPAYNEQATIRTTLEHILQIDYPVDRRQVLVVSDASTDQTNEIVAEFADRGVELLALPERVGKTAAENAARSLVRGEVIVNTDASIQIPPHALKPLVAALADPSVGVASGRDVSVAQRGDLNNAGESSYVEYEMWVRELETQNGGIVGASGCFFATRRELHKITVPEGLSRDFAAPLIARELGYRSVSVQNAICYVPRTSSPRQEYRRKVRTMTRGLETLWYKRSLLNPFRYGPFSWMLFSHKLVRWLVPWSVCFGFIGLGLLAVSLSWPRWVLGAAGMFIVVAVVGWVWPQNRPLPRLLALPTYLVSGTVAGIHAWLTALRRDLKPIWEPTRREGVSDV